MAKFVTFCIATLCLALAFAGVHSKSINSQKEVDSGELAKRIVQMMDIIEKTVNSNPDLYLSFLVAQQSAENKRNNIDDTEAQSMIAGLENAGEHTNPKSDKLAMRIVDTMELIEQTVNSDPELYQAFILAQEEVATLKSMGKEVDFDADLAEEIQRILMNEADDDEEEEQ